MEIISPVKALLLFTACWTRPGRTLPELTRSFARKTRVRRCPMCFRTTVGFLAQEYRLRLNGHRLCYIIPLFKVTYKSTKSSPHQRTHAAEKDTKLVDRNGRKGQPYGHFAQAYRYSLEPDPRNLPLSINRKYGNSLRSCKKVRENRVISE